MRHIIILPGRMSSNFFTSEIKYIKKYFNIDLVIGYKESREICDDIAKKYNFKYKTINDKNIKVLFNKEFWRWLFDKSTRKEIKSFCFLKKQGFKKFLYVLYYGVFCVQAYAILRDIVSRLSVDDELYLYAYWLSRPAYSAAYFNEMNNRKIKKVISRAHGYDLYETRNRLEYLPFRKYINDNLSEIDFISDNGKNYFENKYPFSFDGADKYVSRLGTRNDNIIKKINEKSEICIISCSGIVEVKRLDLIVDFIAGITFPVKWIHIGDGILSDKIKKYAYSKLSAENCIFLGQVDNGKILETYLEYDADYFINMSDSEGIPVSIMEALSFGIPVIARDVGGNSEIITDNVGLLLKDQYNETDIKSAYDFLSKRIDHVEEYEKMSIMCRQKWQREYNADVNYQEFFKRVAE